MAFVEIEDLSFAYPETDRLVLDDINLKINKGEFVLVCGRSGCGKTTLLRRLKPVIAPSGMKKGRILYGGRPLEELSLREQAEKIGFVMQDPESQMVTDKVWHELAFGLENLGYPQDEIRLRTAETAAFFGIEPWFRRSVSELSGGRKQLLNLAAVMAMRPELIVLDEPTSQLDPLAAVEFTDMLKRVNTELGVTVVISEHRLENVFEHADRVLVMDEGSIKADVPPRDCTGLLRLTADPMLCAMPSAARIGEAAGKKGCITAAEAAAALADKPKNDVSPAERPRGTEKVLDAKGIYFKYEKNSRDIARNLSLQLMRGDFFALLGGNGSGKTTALKLLSGVLRPYRGSIKAGGRVLLLPQSPVDLFTEKTVLDDLRQITKDEEAIKQAVGMTETGDILHMHPFDVSGGELQKAAVAKLLLAKPDILLLDEPTKGMDDFFKIKFGRLLQRLAADGLTVLMVSHDIEFCAEYTNRCAMLFDGEIVSTGEPHSFFSCNSFYTTAASRISRGIYKNKITASEVIEAFGGSEPVPKDGGGPTKKADGLIPSEDIVRKNKAAAKRTLISMLIISVLIPLTIWFGMTVLNDRKYYFISMIIIFLTMVPFFMIFENRLARTRELMLIAMLCALACIGRSAFFMVHEFKPVCAVVIISGVCLGAESGFMVGAVSGFVSNFFFGQGPWTPWQMFSFGIIGFLAGLCHKLGIIRKNNVSLAVFGFLTVLFIYGGIMNPAAVIMYQPHPEPGEILLAYMHGFPVDMIHAVGTSIFLVLIGRGMIEKIERVKVKFGLMDTSGV